MNNNQQTAIQKYLNKYSPARNKVELSGKQLQVDTIIVIPVIDEFNNLQKLIRSLSINDPLHLSHTLILFVINNPASAPSNVKEENKKTISFLRSLMAGHLSDYSGLKIGMIDASTPGNELPEKTAGVGLARKIGMDEALLSFSPDAEFPLLVCLDADCMVSPNYIETIRMEVAANRYHAAAMQYEHPVEQLDGDVQRAIVCYELFLRYYTLGLNYAGSPYAFHTIGSTIICSVEAYIKAEGMNKKKAGEDFYFLEKLGKMYPVHTINNALVYPAARSSWRVPFGTGRSIERFLKDDSNEYLLYSLESFVVLKKWLHFFNNGSSALTADYLTFAKSLSSCLYDFLIENNFAADWDKIFSGPAHQVNIQKKIWFDGFRTLKLMHHLRDNEFPNVPMFEALDKLLRDLDENPPTKRDSTIPGIHVQIEYLQLCRRVCVKISQDSTTAFH